MKISIIGGTGKEGSGLAVRWAHAGHEVAIGSRDAARGLERAAELSEEYKLSIRGGGNADIVDGADIVVLSVPYGAHRPTLESLRDALQGKIVLDITVPLAPPKVRVVNLPEGQSAAMEAQALLGEDTRVVASFHHVSYTHLLDLSHGFETDILVAADDRDARYVVLDLIKEIGGRGVDAGKLPNSIALESLTPVLIHINKTYKVPGAGIRITGLPDDN